jgi:hypothetical protein
MNKANLKNWFAMSIILVVMAETTTAADGPPPLWHDFARILLV